MNLRLTPGSASRRRRQLTRRTSLIPCASVAGFLQTRKGCYSAVASASGSSGRPAFLYCILRRAR
jgi:hypothetical protein